MIEAIVESLKGNIGRLEQLQRGVSALPMGSSMVEAFERLAVSLPRGELSLEIAWGGYASADQPMRPSVRFKVWNGKTFFEATTLEQAVNLALEASKPASGLEVLANALPEEG